ncbi:hypothetical protein BDW62DRAFT_202020 [Aspergillus aurantiobrunneus]
MTTLQDVLAEINHHGLTLTPSLISRLNATVEARNAAAASSSSPSPSPSKKRKARTAEPHTVSISSSSDKENKHAPIADLKDTDTDSSDSSSSTISIDSDDPRLCEPKWTCGQIRAKNRKFLKEDKKMKVSGFQAAIGVSSRSYYAFMKMNGA